MIDQTKVVKKLSEIESKFQVESWKYKDIDLWPLVKIILATKVIYGESEKIKDDKKTKFSLLYKKIKKIIIEYTIPTICNFIDKKNQKIKKNDPANFFFFIHSVSRVKVGDFFYEKNSFFIRKTLSALGYSHIAFETTYHNKLTKRVPRALPSYYIQKKSIKNKIIALIKTKFNSNFKNLSLRGFELFQKELSQIFNNQNLINKKEILQNAIFIDLMSNYYEKKFKPKTTKAIFINQWYNHDFIAAIVAAHRKKIPVIEIQHGIIGKSHYAYSNWHQRPNSNFNTLPDHFLVWSKKEEMMMSIKKEKSLIFEIGHLWNMSWKDSKDWQINSFENELNKISKKAGTRKIILFSLQDMPLPDFVVHLVHKTQEDLFWIFRYHPIFDVPDIEKEFSANNNVIFQHGSSYPLEALFKIITVHCTLFSSVVIDSSLANIPSIVFSSRGKEIFADDYQLKDVFYIKNFKGFIELVKKFEKNKSEETHESFNEYCKKKLREFISILN